METDSDGHAREGSDFVALGSLSGYAFSEATAVSADGTVVIGTSTSVGGFRQAFRWTAARGAVGLGFLAGGTFSAGKGVSANGAVVIGDADGGAPPGMHGARWTESTGLIQLSGLHSSNVCSAAAISSDGAQVAGTCAVINNEAFRWSDASGAIGLGRFGTGGNATSSATAMSSDGRVIGGAGHPVIVGAIVWDADERPTILGNPPGATASVVTALSQDGRIAVGTFIGPDGHARAFRWSAETGVNPLMHAEGFVATHAAGISGDGRRIVGWGTTPDGEIAIVWEDDGRLHLVSEMLSPEARAKAEGWHLRRARAISRDGVTVVGDGINATQAQEAWLVTLPR